MNRRLLLAAILILATTTVRYVPDPNGATAQPVPFQGRISGAVGLGLGGGTSQSLPAQEPAATRTPTLIPTTIPSPTVTPLPPTATLAVPSPTASPIPTSTATPTAAPTFTPVPTRTPLPTPMPSPTASPTPAPAPTVTPTPTTRPPSDVVFVGAGDMGDCTSYGSKATATLLDGIAGTVFTLGDNAYPGGSAADFRNCYDPTWGSHKARTRPAAGNHEYIDPGASAYFNYFGPAAGDPKKGYYSYNLGAWHIVVLNTNCGQVGGCSSGSAQEQWLRADLAANPAVCTLAIGHAPRFSSGPHGGNLEVQDFWKVLYSGGVDVVLAGHDHIYERFSPQDPSGKVDEERGIRQFIVGTGGNPLYPLKGKAANSVVSKDGVYGVLKLTLHAAGYDWQFVPEAGKTFTDSGTAACH